MSEQRTKDPCPCCDRDPCECHLPSDQRAAFEAWYRARLPNADFSEPLWEIEWKAWQKNGPPTSNPPSELSERSVMDIEILLRFWWSPLAYQWEWSEEECRRIDAFKDMGLLVPNEKGQLRSNYEALKPYVDALCAVPLPVRRWVMP